MQFVQIEILPAGKAPVDIDKLTHVVPEGDGSRLFIWAQLIDVPHSLAKLKNVLAGRERTTMAKAARRHLASGRAGRVISARRVRVTQVSEALRVHCSPGDGLDCRLRLSGYIE